MTQCSALYGNMGGYMFPSLPWHMNLYNTNNDYSCFTPQILEILLTVGRVLFFVPPLPSRHYNG